MGIEKDIQRLLTGALDKHSGNKHATAESLGVNPVTFWGWVTGKRKPLAALCKAIDNAGGVLLIPGDSVPVRQENEEELARLREKNDFLTRENILLHKLVGKYEAEEHEKKEDAGKGADIHRPTQPAVGGKLTGTDAG